MSNKLTDLEPETCQKVLGLLAAARAEGINLVVVHTLRTFDEQNLLYQKGRTRPGPIVTNARGGWSWHNFGRACDCAFKVAGKVVWEGPWERYGELAEGLGLEWGGRWRRFKDRPHVQLTGGLTLKQLRQTYPTGWTPNS